MIFEYVVMGLVSGGFAGMIIAIYTLIKYPSFDGWKDTLSTMFLIAYIGLWWTGLIWLISKWMN